MKKAPAQKTESKAGRNNKVSGRSGTKHSSTVQAEAEAAKAAKALTQAEKGVFQQCEQTIGAGLGSFVTVGTALESIRVGRLYREESDTFESYCEQRWDLSREYGYRLIKAAECYDKLKAALPKGAILPKNESQVRPLAEGLEPKVWVKAWETVIADTKGVKLTAEAVEKVVRRLKGKSVPEKPEVRKKMRPEVTNKAIQKIVKLADDALRKDKASASDLRKVLETIRDHLNKLKGGTAS
jgi:hypothetical protein